MMLTERDGAGRRGWGGVVLATVVMLLGGAGLTGARADEMDRVTLIRLAVSGTTGHGWATGNVLCNLYNHTRSNLDRPCMLDSVTGSVEILRAVTSGRAVAGVMNADVAYKALRSGSPGLRVLLSLPPQHVQVVVKQSDPARTFAELRDHVVDVEDPRRGGYGTMEDLIRAHRWNWVDFPLMQYDQEQDMSVPFCADSVTGIGVVAHLDSPVVRRLLKDCQGRLLPLAGAEIDGLIKSMPPYRQDVIPAGTYPGMTGPVPTLAVGRAVIALEGASPEVLRDLLDGAFDHIDQVQAADSTLATVTLATLTGNAHGLAWHPATLAYLAGKGLKAAP